MIPYPEPSFRDLCKNYIDAGANVVITHHPHVLGCMEKYKTGHIFYSLGDFIFDGLSNFRRQGGILKLNFQKMKLIGSSSQLISKMIYQSYCQTTTFHKMSQKNGLRNLNGY